MLNLDNTCKNILSQFLSEETISSLSTLLESKETSVVYSSSCKIADAFGAAGSFSDLASTLSDTRTSKEEKLISSFHNNLKLLVQKTWIEESDETLKEEALYHLENVCSVCSEKKYTDCYSEFLTLLTNVVYLMFGSQTQKKDFLEYALRIDPEFGIFWWYISSLPENAEPLNSDTEKTRLILLLGMFFLANY